MSTENSQRTKPRKTATFQGVEEEETAGIQEENKEKQNHGKLRGACLEQGKISVKYYRANEIPGKYC